MDQLEDLRTRIDEIIRQNPDQEEERCGFVHLYGVSAICTLLALKRGLEPMLSSIAGMLHDIWNYQFHDSPDHDKLGALEAKKLLADQELFSESEIEQVYRAVSVHGDKKRIDDDLAELLKDADVLQHYLYHPKMYVEAITRGMKKGDNEKSARLCRLEKVLFELGIRSDVYQNCTSMD